MIFRPHINQRFAGMGLLLLAGAALLPATPADTPALPEFLDRFRLKLGKYLKTLRFVITQ